METRNISGSKELEELLIPVDVTSQVVNSLMRLLPHDRAYTQYAHTSEMTNSVLEFQDMRKLLRLDQRLLPIHATYYSIIS